MQNILLVGAAVAALVAVVATLASVRAGRRAGEAADQVTQLLEPRAVEPLVPIAEHTPLVQRPASDRRTGGRLAPASGDGQRADPGPARIPVLDLDRLRAWLTLDDVQLGRLAVISVELDNLDLLRERLGAAAGAHLVEGITQRLRTVTRPRDVVAHVNHDRFVLVCRDVPDHVVAEALAERVAMAVAHPSLVQGEVVEVTASVGVALAAALAERPEDVLRRAIKAGKHARALGGARIETSPTDPSLGFGARDLSTALAHGELRLHYLPMVSCATSRVAGFEALLRWDHPERGLLSAHEFLPEAERTEQMVPVGGWVLEEACRQMARWHAGAGQGLKLSLNLSSQQFAEPTLPAELERIVGETGLAAGSLWLEITEATLLADRENTDRVLARLRALGARLVIDDFGTGASSLVSLKQFPIDAIKIAHTFVADLGRDRDSTAICNAIVDLAHSLGLCTIAEGVETLDQLVQLRAIGCELAQGHLFGVARPAEAYGRAPSTTLDVLRTRHPA